MGPVSESRPGPVTGPIATHKFKLKTKLGPDPNNGLYPNLKRDPNTHIYEYNILCLHQVPGSFDETHKRNHIFRKLA